MIAMEIRRQEKIEGRIQVAGGGVRNVASLSMKILLDYQN